MKKEKKMFYIVEKLKSNLKKNDIPFLESGSHIVPVIIGDAKLCKKKPAIFYSMNIKFMYSLLIFQQFLEERKD